MAENKSKLYKESGIENPGGESDMEDMASSRVTIKDISRKLGISYVSVHRALSGKEGISNALREKILETSREMGYVQNYAAASIKRKTGRIAVVLPEDVGEKMIYFDYIRAGIKKCGEEYKGLNIEIVSFICSNVEQQLEQMEMIAKAGPEEYAGVITVAFTKNTEFIMLIQKILARNMAMILLDGCLDNMEGLVCVSPMEKQVGMLAAEFISLVIPENGTVLVSEGRADSEMHINRLRSFCEYFEQNKPGIRIVILEGYEREKKDKKKLFSAAYKALEENDDVCAMYALTSSDNAALVNAAAGYQQERKIHIVGTDLNEETFEMIKNGELTGVIDQNAFQKGYRAFKAMADCIVKQVKPPAMIPYNIDIILKNNLDLHDNYLL